MKSKRRVWRGRWRAVGGCTLLLGLFLAPWGVALASGGAPGADGRRAAVSESSSASPIEARGTRGAAERSRRSSRDGAEASGAILEGFADVHNHVFSEYAYQGAWYHGSIWGAEGGDEEGVGMSSCDGNRRGGPQDHAMSILNVICEVAGWGMDDVCLHQERTHGFVAEGDPRNYTDWPNAMSFAHQQYWWGHLHDAWTDGLRLAVVHFTNFKILCDVLEPDNYRYDYNCEDMGAVDLQIEMAHAFVERHSSWMEIAYTPADARRIIGEGKLAVILAIEITDLFETGEMDYAPMVVDEQGEIIDRGGVLTQLQRYYDLGVRVMQIGHELDSRFAGVALYSQVYALLATLVEWQEAHPRAFAHLELPGDRSNNYGFDLDENGYNNVGLSEDGAILVQAMMDLGMIVDISHLSHKSTEDVFEIARANQYYPLFHSHAKLSDALSIDEDVYPLEKWTPRWIADRIRVTGGMVGLRTQNERVNTWPESGVANNCDGSSRSFAQHYALGDQGWRLPLAFAVDMNGFAQQTRPRFGPEACNSAPDTATQMDQQSQQTDAGTGTAFDRIGLGHIGLLGRGLLQDLKNLGLDTSNLEHSAESFVRMWERATDPSRSGPFGPPPIWEESPINVGLEDAEGRRIMSAYTEDAALPGHYTLLASATAEGMRVDLRDEKGTILSSVDYSPTSMVTDMQWFTFAFGDILTLKLGCRADSSCDLAGLDASFFDGQTEIVLEYP